MGKFKNIAAELDISADQIKDEYYLWLYNLIKFGEEDRDSYSILTKRLHSIEFTWSVPNDDNRVLDGVQLRNTFIDESDIGYYERWVLDGPCSVLEMLVGLSIRINDIMADAGDDGFLGRWFWDMIRNLGLIEFTDYNYYMKGGHFAVSNTILKLVERTYTPNGRGGLFPLKRAKQDQREIEIWYQLHAYLHEQDYI